MPILDPNLPGVFRIEEVVPPRNREPILFEWTAAHRNAPVDEWVFGVELRTNRIDYPGSSAPPTEQVLGSNFKPFSLRGRWSDKWNYPGYAVETWKKFEQLVRDGGPVRISFKSITIEGLITDVDFVYVRNTEIGYSFTVSAHHRKPMARVRKQPRSVLNARQLEIEVADVYTAAGAVHSGAPRFHVAGTLHDDVGELYEAWGTALEALRLSINQRVRTTEVEPGVALRHLASMFRGLKNTALELLELANAAASDSDLAFESGPSTLAFDVWLKGMAYQARRMVVTAERAARDLDSRANPPAKALYRPHQGESLYQVSNRFYGTPFNWRRIATRNHLGNEFILTGEELLVIPEALAR